MPTAPPPVKRIRWTQAYRIVPSRFPPVGVFDRIADAADLDALFALEALTNSPRRGCATSWARCSWCRNRAVSAARAQRQ